MNPVLSPMPQQINIFDKLDITEGSRKEYAYRIRIFLDYLRKQGFHRDSFLEFKRYLQARNDLSISSKNKYLIVARIYCKELHKQGLLPIDITQNVRSFKQSRKHKREGLSGTDVAKISEYLHILPSTPVNVRLKAITSLLVLQGLRQIEVVRLDLSDLDLVLGRANILGKGRDDKELIDLHPETVKTLKSYLQISKISDGPVFVSMSNNSQNKRLTTKGLRNIINPVLRKLGIEKSVHGFRHYFTTQLIKTYKSDLLEVCRYTRHKSIETLQVYNDNIKRQADLPRYFATFEGISF